MLAASRCEVGGASGTMLKSSLTCCRGPRAGGGSPLRLRSSPVAGVDAGEDPAKAAPVATARSMDAVGSHWHVDAEGHADVRAVGDDARHTRGCIGSTRLVGRLYCWRT